MSSYWFAHANELFTQVRRPVAHRTFWQRLFGRHPYEWILVPYVPSDDPEIVLTFSTDVWPLP